MAKKFFSKALSVGLSLTLCATMVAPAFALDINQAYIDSLSVKEKNGYKYVELTATEDDREFNMTEDITTDSTLWFKGEDAVLNMNGHTLDHNNANGSAIRTEKTDLTVNGAGKDGEMGTITGGNASNGMNNGGGIFSVNADLTVNDVKFEDNKAELNGSAVWANCAENVTMNNVVAQNNEVTGTGGGAIMVSNTKNVDLDNITIDHNTSGGAGGGLAVQFCGEVDVTDAKITSNESTGYGVSPNNPTNKPVPYGGGVYANETESISMKNVTISGNKVGDSEVLGQGGGMFASECGNITFDNSTITGNQAGNAGGGLYVQNYDTKTTVTTTNNTVIAGNKGWDGAYTNDVSAAAYGPNSGVVINAGAATYQDQSFDGWDDSFTLEKVESTVSEDGSFGNDYAAEDYTWSMGWLNSRWTTPEEEPNPNPGPGTDPGPGPGDTEIEDPDVPLGPGPDDTEIEEPAVPLAGLFTRGDAIGYLWEQSGSPEAEPATFEDVPEDHQWAVAIGWAQDMGIARADEEGNFRPDELVLRGVEDLEADPEGELQEFLNWYAQYAGVELDEGELFIELEGALDDVIMGEEAQVIFDDFFAKLEAALTAAAA